ncbi:hypothetical protein [Shewanella baltica]|uniref:hypothetical protein n=1 Tax=Shewanella baltica TaxID=62322 RepID=UPI0039B03DC1
MAAPVFEALYAFRISEASYNIEFFQLGLVLNIKNTLIKITFFAFVLAIILLVACTFIPTLYKFLGFSDMKEYKDKNGNPIELGKAAIVDACEKEKINCLKDVLLIQGEIDQGTLSSIKKLNSLDKIETMCFRSVGGNNQIAQKLMSFIKEYDINTCLAEEYYFKERGSIGGTYCYSACPLILLMGKERFHVGNEIEIGIHHSGKVFDFCFTCFYMDNGGEDFEPYFTNQGHINLFKRSRNTPLKDMDILEPSEWKKYNIFTNN